MSEKEKYLNVLRYDNKSGFLYWKVRHENCFSDRLSCRKWNARFAGKRALTSDNGKGYKIGAVLGKRVSSHRVVWVMHNGEIPVDMQIDHINGNRSDNRIENLRLVNCSQNNRNRKKQTTDRLKKEIMGVNYRNDCNKWRVSIGVCGSKVNLGTFERYEDAVKARVSAEKYFGYDPRHGVDA